MELSNSWHEAIVSATIAAAWIFSLFGGYLSGKSSQLNLLNLNRTCHLIVTTPPFFFVL